jgi:hypothetical protein
MATAYRRAGFLVVRSFRSLTPDIVLFPNVPEYSTDDADRNDKFER